jgi:O-antigen ligase
MSNARVSLRSPSPVDAIERSYNRLTRDSSRQPKADKPLLDNSSTPPMASSEKILLNAVVALAFAAPFDGFYALTEALGGVSVMKIGGYVAAAILAIQFGKVLQSQTRTFWLWCAAFALGTIVAFTTDASPELSPDVGTLWQMVILWALTTTATRSDGSSTRVIRALVAGLILTCTTYVVLYALDFEVVNVVDRVGSVAGFKSNYAALVGALTLLMITALWSTYSMRGRLMLSFGGLMATYVMLLSNGRGPQIALGLGIVTLSWQWFSIKNAKKLLGVLSAAALIVVAVVSLNTDYREQLLTSIENRWEDNSTLSALTTERDVIFLAALQVAADNPIGVGVGNGKIFIGQYAPIDLSAYVTVANDQRIEAHNEFLRVLVECGWLGFLLYGAGWLLLFLTAIERSKGDDRQWPLAVLVFIVVSIFTDNFNGIKLTWILFGLVCGHFLMPRTGPIARPMFRRSVIRSERRLTVVS